MKKQFYLPLVLLPLFVVNCSNGNNTKTLAGSEEIIEEKQDDGFAEFSKGYMIFDELPTTKEIPNNISTEIDGIRPFDFAYYGTIKGYDVFSWYDDNTFGFSYNFYALDNFCFFSSNRYVFYCVKHDGAQKDFFTYDETNYKTNHLSINPDVVVPFIDLHDEGVFDSNDVGYLYYARGSSLRITPDGFEMIYEYLEDGRVKINNPTINPNDYNKTIILPILE